jgi:N-methylhydantoinase A
VTAGASLEEAFGREHERTYGHRAGADEPVEIVSLRVVGQGLTDRPRVPARPATEPGAPDRAAGPDAGSRADRAASRDGATASRRVYFGPPAGWIDTPVLSRGDLATPREGPAVIEEYDAKCVVPPGARAALDAWGNIVMEV